MANKSQKNRLLTLLLASDKPLSLMDLNEKSGNAVAERTLRRWLQQWVQQGQIQKSGQGRATRYSCQRKTFALTFLQGLDDDLKSSVRKQLRDLWTHASTALEGNTLTLGDTHFVLEEGLTISGKPLKDHQEVIGHAKAIEVVYQSLQQPLDEPIIFTLHKALLTEQVTDIYKPQGAWKIEINGTYTISSDGKQHFIEYAKPQHVPALMQELIAEINNSSQHTITIANAHKIYSKIHMGLVHIHPVWDGNGRLARLLANIPLLKAGLPPLVISQQQRRNYIQILADYQIAIGQLTPQTRVWPDSQKLASFEEFCQQAYSETQSLVEQAFVVQQKRLLTDS